MAAFVPVSQWGLFPDGDRPFVVAGPCSAESREQVLDEEMYFSSKMGGVICKECNETFGVQLKMHHKIRDFLQAMLQFDFNFESDYDKKATEKVCQVCFDLLDEYIKTHTNKRQKSTKLIKELAVCEK